MRLLDSTLKIAACYCLLSMIYGCDNSNIDERRDLTAQALDSWIKVPELESFRKSKEIREGAFMPVINSELSDVINKKLKFVDFTNITRDEMRRLLSSQIQCKENESLFLVRAVRNGYGHFSVNVSGSDVYVNHNSLGQSVNIEKSALVICLEQDIGKLYVIASVAG